MLLFNRQISANYLADASATGGRSIDDPGYIALSCVEVIKSNVINRNVPYNMGNPMCFGRKIKIVVSNVDCMLGVVLLK